jgi:hypothetical protein
VRFLDLTPELPDPGLARGRAAGDRRRAPGHDDALGAPALRELSLLDRHPERPRRVQHVGDQLAPGEDRHLLQVAPAVMTDVTRLDGGAPHGALERVPDQHAERRAGHPVRRSPTGRGDPTR